MTPTHGFIVRLAERKVNAEAKSVSLCATLSNASITRQHVSIKIDSDV